MGGLWTLPGFLVGSPGAPSCPGPSPVRSPLFRGAERRMWTLAFWAGAGRAVGGPSATGSWRLSALPCGTLGVCT